MKAIEFAPLVGKYVRIERDLQEGEDMPWGMDCTVLMVRDEPEGTVTIMADYGYAVTLDDSTVNEYRFTIWPNETLATELRSQTPEAP